MTHEEAIKWLKMQSRKPVKWNDYSEENRVIREEAERRLKEAYNMAIDALKAQEPRVMTLEEYDAWTDLPFIERDPVFHEERTTRGAVTCWVNTPVCPLREYGKNDRCWTGRPTDAQMEATKWIS